MRQETTAFASAVGVSNSRTRGGRIGASDVRPLPALLFLLVLPHLPLEAQERAAESFTLPGQVFDIRTELPIPGVEVEIPELGRAVVADSMGYFTFSGLEPGHYTFEARRIGYATSVEPSDVQEGNFLIIMLMAQALSMPEIVVIAERADERFERRSRRAAVTSWASDFEELRQSAAPTLHAYLGRLGIQMVPCSELPDESTSRCAIFRGIMGRVRFYVDDMLVPSGMIDHYRPDELYRLEAYHGLGQIRAYTPWYARRIVQEDRGLPAICTVC